MKLYALIILIALFASCAKDKTEPMKPMPTDCLEEVSFVNDVQVIFNVNCSTSGCHDAQSATSGYVFETHAQIASSAEVALKAMQHNPDFTPMPFGQTKLEDSLIQKVRCWIDQGKKMN